MAELPAEGLQIRYRPTGSRSATYELVAGHGRIFGGYGQALVEDRRFRSETVGALIRRDNRAQALPG